MHGEFVCACQGLKGFTGERGKRLTGTHKQGRCEGRAGFRPNVFVVLFCFVFISTKDTTNSVIEVGGARDISRLNTQRTELNQANYQDDRA